MILGLGIDLVEVSRIADSYERFGERWFRRILTDAELAYCLRFQNPAPHLAARFAAKEAVSKAFGTGIGAELGWLDMAVDRSPSGQPLIQLTGAGAELLRRRGGTSVHLSLTHTTTHAAAVAVIEG